MLENDSKGDSVHELEDKLVATDVGWKATSDLLLPKNVRRLDTSQSFVGPRAKIKPGRGYVPHATEDDNFVFTVQIGARVGADPGCF